LQSREQLPLVLALAEDGQPLPLAKRSFLARRLVI